jgi:hypothetical protein
MTFMKSIRLLLTVVLISFATLTFAQTKAAAPQSDAQKSFTLLKSLAGAWQGPATTEPKMSDVGGPVLVTMRVTSRGNALAHEMKDAKAPDDPNKFDHPLTTFYLDNDRLLLTHYCDAGNRPRMVARTSPDGKKVEFDFLDVSGSTQYGHMQHAIFTIIDANHHTEDWTYLMPGDKPMHAHLDLQRAK